MKKKIILGTLVLAMMGNIVACGTNEKINNNTTSESVTNSEELTSSTETSSKEETTKDDTDPLTELLKEFEATNAVNTTDVSGYYFKNSNIVFNVKFDELQNIESLKTEIYKSDYSGTESDVTFSSWNELKDEFDENEDYNYNIDVAFKDGSAITVGNRKLRCFPDIDKYYVYCKDHKSAYCQTFETLMNNGAFKISDDMLYNSLDLTSYVNIGLEEDSDVSTQLLKLKELWGNPSIVESNSAYSRISWCFGNTSFTITAMGILDDIIISGVEYSWTTYEQMYDFITEKKYDGYTEAEPQEIYEPNLPEKALMTYGNVSVPLINNSFKDVYELMDSFELLEGTSYDTPDYADIKYWYVPGDSIIANLQIDDCNDGTGNVKEVSIYFKEGLNLPEISILGISASSTLDDIFKIFGTPESDDYESIIYDVVIDGVPTHVYITTEGKYGTRVADHMRVEFYYDKQ